MNVREVGEIDQPLADERPFEPPVSEGGGLATATVCGEGPIQLESFGEESHD